MRNYTIRHINTHKEIYNYIGRWYEEQHKPQPIELYITKDKVWIDYNPIIGSGRSPEIWYGICLAIEIPVECLSVKESKKILSENKKLIKKLQKKYYEYRDRNLNLIGDWDEDLTDNLTNILREYTTDYYFYEEDEEEEYTK